MDYSQLSDFEINRMVGDIIFKGLWACKPETSGNNTNKWYYGNSDTSLEPLNPLPDYCNDPSASWPIIEKYRISILDQLTEWCVDAKGVSPIFDISALVICIIVCLLWAVNHYRDNAMTYKEQRDKATSTIADMQKRQRDVAELDARYTKELADANATIESLHADVSAGRKRLQVAATCAKSTTGASGMGDGESPGLTADAELNYYRLRSGIDRITAQVNYLQEYIRTQCLK
ncbi:DUF2591 domain-containing protein [Escherichia coli]|nr:DUF2591 domain-containing protein [Escherichia coli]